VRVAKLAKDFDWHGLTKLNLNADDGDAPTILPSDASAGNESAGADVELFVHVAVDHAYTKGSRSPPMLLLILAPTERYRSPLRRLLDAKLEQTFRSGPYWHAH
jgi:hypothetical protein